MYLCNRKSSSNCRPMFGVNCCAITLNLSAKIHISIQYVTNAAIRYSRRPTETYVIVASITTPIRLIICTSIIDIMIHGICTGQISAMTVIDSCWVKHIAVFLKSSCQAAGR